MTVSSDTKELIVTTIPPHEKHPTIFKTFDGLQKGESFILVNDHDPRPLHYQFDQIRADQFEWEYVEQGPETWKVRLTKVGE
jgi:uncharacterized protein (DUF2249 family)